MVQKTIRGLLPLTFKYQKLEVEVSNSSMSYSPPEIQASKNLIHIQEDNPLGAQRN